MAHAVARLFCGDCGHGAPRTRGERSGRINFGAAGDAVIQGQSYGTARLLHSAPDIRTGAVVQSFPQWEGTPVMLHNLEVAELHPQSQCIAQKYGYANINPTSV